MRRIKYLWEQHPALDLLVGLLLVVVAWLAKVNLSDGALGAMLPALSALAALVFTAGTFAASQAAQSTAPVTVMLREANSAQLHRTWRFILVTCLVVAAISLALLAVPADHARTVSVLAFGLLGATAACGWRAVTFSLAVLAADQMRDPRPAPIPGPADD